ncbi:uncharacterized protein [Struthio camelus]|uniref:uncharacterized protein isoform X2 n=1 Tax=Struthio camelus TaxID=8801 RepID=UPI0036041372
MDDILFASPSSISDMELAWIENTLLQCGLKIAPEKVQRQPDWKYLGWVITEEAVRPQKTTVHTTIRTLADAQRLIGDIQWIRPLAGITNDLLQPLLPTLRGGDRAAERLMPTKEQQRVIDTIGQLLSTAWADRFDPAHPIIGCIYTPPSGHLHAVLAQREQKKRGEGMRILEWVYPKIQPRMSMAVLGVPRVLKTDNGLCYISQRFQQFCRTWGIEHVTGIPHNPTGQAIVERANRTLKEMIIHQKMRGVTDPELILGKAVFTLNFLCITEGHDEPPILIHQGPRKRETEIRDRTDHCGYQVVGASLPWKYDLRGILRTTKPWK